MVAGMLTEAAFLVVDRSINNLAWRWRIGQA
jgi:hypothetical protein